MGNSIAEGYRGLENERVTMYVVANRTEAVFYVAGNDRKLQFVERLRSPRGQLREVQLDSDRPGTGVSSAGGGTIRHGMDAGFHRHEQVAKIFARRIAALLEIDFQHKRFGELVLVAGPHFLGLIRAELDPQVAKSIRYEIAHEYAEGSDEEIEAHIRKALEAR